MPSMPSKLSNNFIKADGNSRSEIQVRVILYFADEAV
jgi:hypothetical protein